MTFTVIKEFYDLTDYKSVKNSRIYYHYDVGDPYPRPGLKPNAARIEELATDQNVQGQPLIIADEFLQHNPDNNNCNYADQECELCKIEIPEKKEETEVPEELTPPKPKRKRRVKKPIENVDKKGELMPGA